MTCPRAWPPRLADYPFRRVVVSCGPCRRRGDYSLVRLALWFGGHTDLGRVMIALTRDCPYQFKDPDEKKGARDFRCAAEFSELEAWLRESYGRDSPTAGPAG